MIFLFPVPLWFVLLGLAGSLVFLIYDMVEDAELRSESRYHRSPDELDALAKSIERHLTSYKIAEAERLLKRLAETCK